MKSASAAELAEMGTDPVRGNQCADRETGRSIVLESIDIPPPVFFCSVEPASAAIQNGRVVVPTSNFELHAWSCTQNWTMLSLVCLVKTLACVCPSTLTLDKLCCREWVSSIWKSSTTD